MYAIIDARTEKKAIKKLRNYVNDVLLFKSECITYNSISGHPDIFIYVDKKNIVIAPNAPRYVFDFFELNKINFKIGNKSIGFTLKNSTLYNCLSNKKYFFHKKNFSDNTILKLCYNKKFINLPQAYTRCSMVCIDEDNYITSDHGIEKILKINKFNTLYFSPKKIRIIDHRNGFLGGTCGLYNRKLFFNGNIDLHDKDFKLRNFIEKFNIEIINLQDDFLYDGGGILFVKND